MMTFYSTQPKRTDVESQILVTLDIILFWNMHSQMLKKRRERSADDEILLIEELGDAT